jgi:hypothetical protein
MGMTYAMGRLILVVGAVLLSAGMLLAEVTGKYTVELERPAGLAARDGEGPRRGGAGGRRAGGFAGSLPTELNLKEESGKLTGTATIGTGERSREMKIENGTIAEGKFSFETSMETQMGKMTMLWEGAVEGEQLKGKRTVKEFDRPGQSFTAKKK